MAIAVDATSEVFGTTGTTTNVSHTCTGSDLVLIACVHMNGGTASGVTYNSVAMTQAITIQSGTDPIHDYIFYLANPATGANTLEVTHTSGADCALGGVSFTGAHTSDPIGGSTSKSGTTSVTSFGDTVTTTGQNGYVVDVMRAQNPLTVDASQTRFMTQDSFNGNRSAGASYESFTGGSNVSMDWTMSASNLNLLAAVEVKELVESTFVPRMMMF